MRPSPFIRRLLPAALLTLSGCLGGGSQTELLEARLRDQSDMLARYEKILSSTQSELDVARKESNLLREQIADLDAQPLLPEHADVLLRAEKLAFHGMMTGSRDADGAPGEEVLSVVLSPQSKKGETVRLVGELEIKAIDLARPAGEQQIGRWSFTPQAARDNWHSGFLASGFQFELPWQGLPQGEEVILHARMRTPDGREFNATHTLKVDPAALASSAPAASNGEPRLLPAAVGQADRPTEPDASSQGAAVRPVAASQVNAPRRTAQLERSEPVEARARSMSGAEFLETISDPSPVAADRPYPASSRESSRERPVPPPQDLTEPGAPMIEEPAPLSPPPFPRRAEAEDQTATSPLPRVEQTAMKSPASPFSELVHPASALPPTVTGEAPPFPDARKQEPSKPVQTSDSWTVDVIPAQR
jgi:hypothetical protein